MRQIWLHNKIPNNKQNNLCYDLFPDNSTALWVQVWGTRLDPQSQLPARLCPGLGLLCAGSWEGRTLDLASPPNSREEEGRRAVGGRGPDACRFPVGPLPLICQAAECWSQVFFFSLQIEISIVSHFFLVVVIV